MALTSAASRISAQNFLKPTQISIIPDGTIAGADRQTAAHSYGGILSATLTQATGGQNVSNYWWWL